MQLNLDSIFKRYLKTQFLQKISRRSNVENDFLNKNLDQKAHLVKTMTKENSPIVVGCELKRLFQNGNFIPLGAVNQTNAKLIYFILQQENLNILNLYFLFP